MTSTATVSSHCRTVALLREELRKTPGQRTAITLQNAKREMNSAAAQVRAGFRLIERT